MAGQNIYFLMAINLTSGIRKNKISNKRLINVNLLEQNVSMKKLFKSIPTCYMYISYVLRLILNINFNKLIKFEFIKLVIILPCFSLR